MRKDTKRILELNLILEECRKKFKLKKDIQTAERNILLKIRELNGGKY